MKSKPLPFKQGEPFFAFTDRSTVKLDFDNVPLKEVKHWAFRTMIWFRLEGFAIAESSENHDHVVFDRLLTWSKNVHVMNWIKLEAKDENLEKYVTMQGIKENSTLRVTPKKGRPQPRIIFSYGKQDNGIKEYLSFIEECN